MAAPNPAAGPTEHKNEKGEITISVDELLRTREQLVTGLTNISAALHEFVRSYIQHTNKWIGTDTVTIPQGLDLTSMSNLFTAEGPSVLPTADDGKGKKKKRERKAKDPNAPKRPLTPFFLYSQSARAIVKNDMGPEAASAEINAEILRRWNDMGEAERKGWKDEYEGNAQVYRDQKAAYDLTKAGKAPAADEADAEGEDAVVGAADSSDDEVSEQIAHPPTPPPAPKARAKAAPKGKKAAEASTVSVKQSAVPLPGKTTKRKAADDKTDKAAEKPDEPKKKRARKSKADEAAKEAEKPKEVPAPKETAAQKKRKKKEAAN